MDAVHGGECLAGELSDLLKGLPAPDAEDHHFAMVGGKCEEDRLNIGGADRRFGGGCQQGASGFAGEGLLVAPIPGAPAGKDCVSNDAEKPSAGLVRSVGAAQEFDKGFLHDILGIAAGEPGARVENKWRGV